MWRLFFFRFHSEAPFTPFKGVASSSLAGGKDFTLYYFTLYYR